MSAREVTLFIHFVGLAMTLGTGFAFMFLGIAQSKMEEAEGEAFMVKALSIGRMGDIGLIIMILSGLYLLMPHMSALGSMPLMHVKLTLIVVLLVLIGMIHKATKEAKQENGGPALETLRKLGTGTLVVTLLIVLMAVLNFN